MTAEIRVQLEPLGGSSLAALGAGGADSPWFAPRPRSARDWERRAQAVRGSASPDWLDALRPAFGATMPQRLQSAARDGIVVTTGQQPGLFGGPIYTLIKALGTLAIADALQETTGIPTAAVFWAATDDSDFAEAARAWVVDEGELHELRLQPTAPENTPMSAVPIGGDVQDLVSVMRRAAGSASDSRAIDRIIDQYREGRSLGDAYVAQLRSLLEPLGIAVLDSSHAALRAAAAPVLRRAHARASQIERALLARDAELRERGHAPQVTIVKGRSLVFAMREGQRARLKAGEALRDESLSANVLLRPIVERSVLPTVAYVAGPGELAYFAQLGPVADVLEVETPLALPRPAVTVLEPRTMRILERLGVEPAELIRPHGPEGRLARREVPPPIANGLTGLRRAIDDALNAFPRGDGAPLLPDAVPEGARRAIQHRLDRLERRYVAAAKRATAETQRDLARARTSLRPLGRRQERVLAFAPLLARYGAPLLEAFHVAAREHARQVIAQPDQVGLAEVRS